MVFSDMGKIALEIIKFFDPSVFYAHMLSKSVQDTE